MQSKNSQMLSSTEENYLKAIYKISEQEGKAASTNAISNEIKTSAASVSDMLQRLSSKGLTHYEKYKGVTLTEKGNQFATALIRKHRLWEVFLVEKLDFTWDKVHDLAEQLEHIQSPELVNRLDKFLDNPKFDPHGDPIPDADGVFEQRRQVKLSELEINESGILVGVQEDSSSFLQYLDKMGLKLGVELKILEKFEFDNSIKLLVNQAEQITISNKVCKNLFLKK